MGCTSRSVSHILNNSSLKYLNAAHQKWMPPRVFEWAVERKQQVSCQGEHAEIINIINCTDTVRRRVRPETGTSTLHFKGEIYCIAWCGPASWFSRFPQTVQVKLFLRVRGAKTCKFIRGCRISYEDFLISFNVHMHTHIQTHTLFHSHTLFLPPCVPHHLTF